MGNAKYELAPRETEALTFGRYELTRKLSQGGMAEIYLARQSGIEDFEKQVVVKIVLPQLAADADYEEMLRDEARMAARLNHPNIVQILDLGKLDGRFFIAMEYLEGQNLHSIAQRAWQAGNLLPIGFVCRVVADVLSGLEHAHAQKGDDGSSLGIIHRDVSPPNVIVTWAGTTKIVDFGIAKATRARDASVTNAGQFKGKLGYMSPEQVRRQPLDGRTDIFSTGVILWELITGKRLFRRAGDVETVRAVLEQEVVPPSVYNPNCPPELDAIILRALERPLAARFGSARAMRKALEELIREQAWPSDSLTMQRALRELFGEDTGARPSPPPRPRLVVDAADETTTRTIKTDPSELDSQIIELTAPFEPTQPFELLFPKQSGATGRVPVLRPQPRLRRRFPIALGVAIGLAGCALVTSLMRHTTEPAFAASLPASVRAIDSSGAGEANGVYAGVPSSAGVVGSGGGSGAAPELAVPSVAEPSPAPAPARAKVQVRVDVKAIVRIDGRAIDADQPFEVDPATRHTVTVQRPGHHALRTMELPPLEPGQLTVIGLWLRGQPDGEPAHASSATAGAGAADDEAADAPPATAGTPAAPAAAAAPAEAVPATAGAESAAGR